MIAPQYCLALAIACAGLHASGAVADTISGKGQWVAAAPIEFGDARWPGNFAPAEGPERAGQPTTAIRWNVDRRPNPNTMALVADWCQVAAVRFWLNLDKPQNRHLGVVLTGSSGGYFLANVPLDWTGWKQITLPMERFEAVRRPEVATTHSLGFRTQGAGQTPVEAGTVWWLDGIELLATDSTKALPLSFNATPEENGRAWQALAADGNPFYRINAQVYASPQSAFVPPDPVTNRWTYAGWASDLVPVAFAAADPLSSHRGRPDLVAYTLDAIDWLVNSCDEEGRWWKAGQPNGDPNVNRFTLAPLLDCVRWMRMLPEGEMAWPRWEKKLATAMELQRRAYRKELDWDWGGLNRGLYVNQDAYYLLCLALAGELWKNEADLAAAREMAAGVADQLLPEGGWHYISVENESPTYHMLNLILIGRYVTLTGDEKARAMLAKTAPYWPLVCTEQGFPEAWSDVWWKQPWRDVGVESLVIAAGASGEARNRYLLWRGLERTPYNKSRRDSIYCAPFWNAQLTKVPDAAAPLRKYVTTDANMRGARGRDGDWYFGVTQGRGLRNTFVGGLVSKPGLNPLRAAFRGAEVLVYPTENGANPLALSQMQDKTGLAFRAEGPVALGARYSLQPYKINGIPMPETPDTDWKVTQVWRASGDGALGLVTLESVRDTKAFAVAGRLLLGPAPVREAGNGLWTCGDLQARVLQGFGTVKPTKVAYFSQNAEEGWPALEWKQPVEGGLARAGQKFQYALWVGPQGKAAPVKFEPLPDDSGFSAQWPDGRKSAIAFNPSSVTTVVNLLEWPGARVSQGLDPKKPVTSRGGQIQISLAPQACAIVE